jgi:hypothetical protein
MRKLVLAAALLAAASYQSVSAADRQCYSAADVEAEQAILFQTNLMVISTACRENMAYAQFRQRNQDAIMRYQKAMIDHFRRAGSHNATSDFDRWNTSLSNEISLKQGQLPMAQVCQQAAEILKLASTLDAKGLHDLAVAKATSAADSHPRCSK